MTQPDPPGILPAAAELTALAVAVRRDWDARSVAGALAAAQQNGWPWPRALVETARLMADPQASPRDLLDRLRDPLHRGGGLPQERLHQRAAELRALLPQPPDGNDAA